MPSPVIKIEHLSKKFIISHETAERYTSLRDVIVRKAKGLTARKADKNDDASKEEFYALNDVSFNIQAGERVGIIGRNGAGKSTLLKILSRITEPSGGRITIRGRVASLLEVGTGFHPELTGRENVFLNGAILGMSRVEIRRKFDEIVAFAEIEKFLDTPVKRYSSGMYVRLAFAVAAYLEPEILVIDEVLAVGDIQFQKKCLGKMEDVSKNDGRTVLFVSHSMPTVLNLCDKCIYLEKGAVKAIGETAAIVSDYIRQEGEVQTSWRAAKDEKASRSGAPYFTVTDFYLQSSSGKDCTVLQAEDNDRLDIIIEGIADEIDDRFNLGYVLKNEFGEDIIMTYSTDQPETVWPKYKKGKNAIRTSIDTSILNEGKYYIYLLGSLHCVKMLLTPNDNICLGFEVVGNRGNSPYWINRRSTILAPYIVWEQA
jgi:lipopolysaccharide transport system ATP-binding protein